MTLRRIKIVILFLAAFLLQGNAVHFLSINGGSPELLLVLTVCYTFLEESPAVYRTVFVVALAAGLCKDICYGWIIGLSPLLYLAIGYLMLYFQKRLNNESVVMMITVMMLSTAVFATGQWLLSMLFTQSLISPELILTRLPGALLWNSIASLIFFYFSKRKKRSHFN